MVERDPLARKVPPDALRLLLALRREWGVAPALDNALFVEHGLAVSNQIQITAHRSPHSMRRHVYGCRICSYQCVPIVSIDELTALAGSKGIPFLSHG